MLGLSIFMPLYNWGIIIDELIKPNKLIIMS